MARGRIPITITKVDGEGNLEPTTGSVTVNIRGGAPATIYTTPTGNTSIGATVVVDESMNGQVPGWLDDGSYDCLVAGEDITSYTREIEIVNGQAINAFDGARINPGSIATAALANSAVTGSKIANQTITKGKLDPDVLPIGTIIQYWRPSNSHPLPGGWAECKGTSIGPGDHDFTGGGTIVLPDLRNKYIRGADSSKAMGAAGALSNAVADAPGLSSGGDANAGGSNSVDLTHQHTHAHDHSFAHSHGIPDHTHPYVVPNHQHSLGVKGIAVSQGSAGYYGLISANGGPNWTGGANIGDWWNSTQGFGGANTNSQNVSTTGPANPPTTSPAGLNPHDNRPRSYGLIYLIKIKATT